MFSTAFQIGIGAQENNQTNFVLKAKFGWDEDEYYLYSTMYTCACLLGVAIGSLGGSDLADKLGLRNTIIWVNFICILFQVLKIIENYWLILVGKLLVGTATGILGFCYGKCLDETIP